MFQSVPFYIGLRYTRAKRRHGFISFVSSFALYGMALGVFAVIVVLSVMNGFDNEIKSRILRVVPHGFLSTQTPLTDWSELEQKIAASPGLVASAPYVDGTGLIAFSGGVRGVEIHGILPEKEALTSEVDESMLIGELENLSPRGYGIIIGRLLANYLGVTTGDKVTLTLPEVSITPAGVFPRSKRFSVVGVFEVGAQVDQYMTLIHLEDAQRLFRKANSVDGLHLKFEDIYKAPLQIKHIATRLGPSYTTKDWSQTQGSLFQAVKMEKTVVGIMLSIIIAVAAFNIVTSLVMMVTEKRGDIAVLRTLGLSRRGVVGIFMVQGTMMGLVGICIGAFSGIITALYLSDLMVYLDQHLGWQVFDPDVFFVAHLPSVWKLSDSLAVCSLAFVVSFFATIYPAYRASTISPAEALRYDT